MNPLKR